MARRALPGLRLALPGLALLGALLLPSVARADEEAEEDEGLSKKQEWLRDKADRGGIRAHRPARGAEPVVSLHNLWTGEVLPLRRAPVQPERWSLFLRCHHTNQRIEMDGRLLDLLRRAAARFHASVVHIISGFRAPKYNLMLRKKGRQVARDSQHTHGHAIDFRLPGVQLAALRRFVLAQRLGGVGYYPRSEFVHADTGPVRSWVAE
ncbi:MAG: DUF882 domain-containing protein [Myxococcales bacterium]|nr:DUF882 domain-containing protein [Myxococcota bacterium]MDW8283400.1 DUF882 domain-containing protein [Myxococcales bacterium]